MKRYVFEKASKHFHFYQFALLAYPPAEPWHKRELKEFR